MLLSSLLNPLLDRAATVAAANGIFDFFIKQPALGNRLIAMVGSGRDLKDLYHLKDEVTVVTTIVYGAEVFFFSHMLLLAFTAIIPLNLRVFVKPPYGQRLCA